MRWISGVLAIVLAVAVSVIASARDAEKGPEPTVLDCGADKKGSKAAYHEFMAILREGDEATVRAVLEDGREFGWLTAHTGGVNGPAKPIIDENRPNDAAREVGDLGGLPITIERFFNIDPPRGTTDAGFAGSWGRRDFVGKGAIDCNEGKVIVTSVGIRKNEDQRSLR